MFIRLLQADPSVAEKFSADSLAAKGAQRSRARLIPAHRPGAASLLVQFPPLLRTDRQGRHSLT